MDRAVRSSKAVNEWIAAPFRLGVVVALLGALIMALPAGAQSPTPPAWAHTAPSTGVAAVDAAVAAVLAGDADALFEQLDFNEVECQTQPGLGGLRCPEGVANGTPIKAIFTGQCELSGLPESEASPSDVAFAVRSGLFLYAAGVATPSQSAAAPKYLLFFGSADDPGTAGAQVPTADLPVILGVTDAGVTRLSGGCSSAVADTAANAGVTEWLLAPKSAGDATPTSATTPGVPSVGTGSVASGGNTVVLLFGGGAVTLAAAAGAVALRRRA